MYTNVSNIIKTMIRMLERDQELINSVVQEYESDKVLTIWEGMRKTLPLAAFPSFEIEPTSGANSWETTRAQRPRYSFECTLTVKNSNEDFGVEYIATIATVLAEIMTDPTNLQLPIDNEMKWDPNAGLLQTFILDSLVEDITYNANKDGTIRVVQFGYFATVHETFPDNKWLRNDHSTPTVIRPRTVIVP